MSWHTRTDLLPGFDAGGFIDGRRRDDDSRVRARLRHMPHCVPQQPRKLVQWHVLPLTAQRHLRVAVGIPLTSCRVLTHLAAWPA